MQIDASKLRYDELNVKIRETNEDCELVGCMGQRFIAAGLNGKKIDIKGVPGNALGAYLNGAVIDVEGNAQDAVGDTMNDGEIIVHGNIGDAAGYAMRGGKIFVRGNAGYRAGIHMKAYKQKVPVMIIGGTAGSFLGEYQAGGIIIVLDLDEGDKPIVGNFPCTGMHGGRMYLRSDCKNIDISGRVNTAEASEEDMALIEGYIVEYCEKFGLDKEKVLDHKFTLITPDSKNPYKQMYVAN